MEKKKSLLIRRIIAIALTVLAAASLFWPSMIRLNSDYREMLNAKLSQIPPYELERSLQRNARDIASKLSADPQKVLSDMKKLYGIVKDGSVTAYELQQSALIGGGYSDQVKAMIDQQLSYRIYDSYYDAYTYQTIPAAETYKNYVTYAKIGVIVYNVLFFAMLACCLLSIVLMILNKRALNVLHTVFAFLLIGAFTAAIILSNRYTKGSFYSLFGSSRYYGEYEVSIPNPFVPGVSLFLTPILSLAACILYRRGSKEKAAAPAYTSAYAPAYTPAWQPQPVAPQPEPVKDWTCPCCNAKNPLDADFCEYCGGRNPAPMPKKPVQRTVFCTHCGKQIDADMRFCKFCGKQQF